MTETSAKFVHKVNKSEIPVCNIMGVDIAAIDMNWLLKFTEKYIKDLSGDYCCVSNVHTTVTSWEDKNYCTIQNGGILAMYRMEESWQFLMEVRFRLLEKSGDISK